MARTSSAGVITTATDGVSAYPGGAGYGAARAAAPPRRGRLLLPRRRRRRPVLRAARFRLRGRVLEVGPRPPRVAGQRRGARVLPAVERAQQVGGERPAMTLRTTQQQEMRIRAVAVAMQRVSI